MTPFLTYSSGFYTSPLINEWAIVMVMLLKEEINLRKLAVLHVKVDIENQITLNRYTIKDSLNIDDCI